MSENENGYGHYNPVEVTISPNESLGTIFLGILCLILLIALLRSQRQVRQLLRTDPAMTEKD